MRLLSGLAGVIGVVAMLASFGLATAAVAMMIAEERDLAVWFMIGAYDAAFIGMILLAVMGAMGQTVIRKANEGEQQMVRLASEIVRRDKGEDIKPKKQEVQDAK